MNTGIILLTAFLAIVFVVLSVIAIIRSVKKKKALWLWLAAALCFITMMPLSLIGTPLPSIPLGISYLEQSSTPLTLPVLPSPDLSRPNEQYLGMMGDPTDLTALADYINEFFENAGSSSYAKVTDNGSYLQLFTSSSKDNEMLKPILCEALNGKNVAGLSIDAADINLITELNCAYLGLNINGFRKITIERIKDLPFLKKVYIGFDYARTQIPKADDPQLWSVDEVEYYGDLVGSSAKDDYTLNNLITYPNAKKLVFRDVTRYYNCEYLKTVKSIEDVLVTDEGAPELTAYFALVAQDMPNIKTINGREAASYDPYEGLEDSEVRAANACYLYSLGQILRTSDLPQTMTEPQYGGTANMAVQFVGSSKDGMRNEGCSQYYTGEDSELAEIFKADVRQCDFFIAMYPEYSRYGKYENNKPAYSTTAFLMLYDLKNGISSPPIKVHTNPPPKTIVAGADAAYGEFPFDKAWGYIEMLFSKK